jgi:hypothetical protein
MNREFFERKVSKLSDDKLQDLLKLKYDANREIVALAIKEAGKRGLELLYVPVPPDKDGSKEHDDKQKLEKWNWGAFLLAPFWTLSNKLDKWAILTFIPGVNVIAIIYLGLNGNRLAYDKSDLRSVDEFMILQRHWSNWGVGLFWISLAIFIIGLFISAFDI